MNTADPATPPTRWAVFEPLREPSFRTIWSASLVSNLGLLILGVGAAWEMTRLSNSPSMVALVQSALMLPLMLVAVPAGAFADMFDRRKVAIAGLCFSAVSALLMTVLAGFGLASPWVLLASCVLIGAGVALYGPAWQASVIELVRPQVLPAAVALSSVSYNIARSFGPALGGVIVVTVGAIGTFALSALFFLPLLAAFYLWKRAHVPPRLPPEQVHRAVISGWRYAIHSFPVRNAIVRVSLSGFTSAAVLGLTPLVARDLLGGDARTYGLLLGANGVGAVLGALSVGPVRERISAELAVRIGSVVTGLMIVGIGFSPHLLLTAVCMLVVGAANLLLITLMSVGVQLSAPRWVSARALSWFQSALTGGIALGAWFWGYVTTESSLVFALGAAGITMMLSPLIGLLLPMPQVAQTNVDPVEVANEPEVALAITPRSGPIVVEIEYCVEPEQSRRFYEVMLKIQRMRLRNGAFDWSLSRDIAEPMLWIERFHCPTWGDYLRQRSRFTQADRDLQVQADAFHTPRPGPRVHRRLERPFGSVRWRADSPESGGEHTALIGP